MTIIIGIKCKDGVVLAADSGATQGFTMQSNKKLHLIMENCMIGVSGPEGMGQLIRAVIERAYTGNNGFADEKFKVPDVMLTMANNLRPLLLSEREVAIKANLTPQQLDQTSTNTLLTLTVQDSAVLMGFNELGSPQEITEHLPVASIGSGHLFAQPFLGFIRRVVWAGQLPNLAEGKMAAYWAMKHTLSLAAGNVQPPIKVATLSKQNDSWVAAELDDTELEEHEGIISELEKYIQQFPKTIKPGERIPQVEPENNFVGIEATTQQAPLGN